MTDNKNIKFIVRPMKTSDFEEVRQIWGSVNFFISKYDNEVMMKVDAMGLFVAEDIQNGKLLGVCSGVNLSHDLAFIGQYAVRREYQKLGIGSEIWRKVIEHIGPDRNIVLFARGVMAQIYRDKCNFTVVPECSLICFTGKVNCNQLIQAIDGISVVPISDDNINKVIQYDKEVCDGLDRTVLIQEVTKIPEYVNKVALNNKEEVVGYCMLKVTYSNMGKVEPLYANDEKIAELLLAKCCKSMAISETNGVIYQCFNTNPKTIAFAKRVGLEILREQSILFTKRSVNGDMDRIYCNSSPCFYPF